MSRLQASTESEQAARGTAYDGPFPYKLTTSYIIRGGEITPGVAGVLLLFFRGVIDKNEVWCFVILGACCSPSEHGVASILPRRVLQPQLKKSLCESSSGIAAMRRIA